MAVVILITPCTHKHSIEWCLWFCIRLEWSVQYDKHKDSCCTCLLFLYGYCARERARNIKIWMEKKWEKANERLRAIEKKRMSRRERSSEEKGYLSRTMQCIPFNYEDGSIGKEKPNTEATNDTISTARSDVNRTGRIVGSLNTSNEMRWSHRIIEEIINVAHRSIDVYSIILVSIDHHLIVVPS